ncbi:MAG: 2-hydroxyacid dehydrogenase [Steroidobacteraceae bacterium]
MAIEALQMCPFSPFLERELRARFELHRWFEVAERDRFAWGRAHAVRAVVTGGHIGISPDLMARLPRLGIVAINGVGFDKVDLEEARRRGIRVSITPNVLTDDVADLAVGLIIALLRDLPASERHVREGLWPTGERPLSRKVSGRRFGIIGLGNIGAAIAARLTPFGSIAYCDVQPKQASYEFVASTVQLARQSEVLILATTANASTRKLVGREVLEALGPNGYLVNVARGSLVDEDELIRALSDRRIAGAALDVFADEPRVPEILRSMPNVILTPHIASATVETREAMARAVVANLDAYFAGQPLPGAIT